MKTSAVKSLFLAALDSLPTPRSEHVIDEVFEAIEKNPHWLGQYEKLCDEFTKTVVNSWGAYWVGNSLGKVGKQTATSKRSSLIGSYSILDADVTRVVRKPKEPEARQLMANYYYSHQATLPADMKKYREALIELIMEGMSPPEAFSTVLGKEID